MKANSVEKAYRRAGNLQYYLGRMLRRLGFHAGRVTAKVHQGLVVAVRHTLEECRRPITDGIELDSILARRINRLLAGAIQYGMLVVEIVGGEIESLAWTVTSRPRDLLDVIASQLYFGGDQRECWVCSPRSSIFNTQWRRS